MECRLANPKVMRECRGCGVVGEHYTRKLSSGKYAALGKCAECERKRKLAWGQANRDKARARNKRYESSEKGRQQRAGWKRTEKGREKAARDSAGQDQMQTSARSAIRRAADRGEIQVPWTCPRCGGPPTPHGGNKIGMVCKLSPPTIPLAVEWVCVPCHQSERGGTSDVSTWTTWEKRAARDRVARRAKIKAAREAYEQ